MAIKITGTTVINDTRGVENIADINRLIKKPEIISPTDGGTDVALDVTIQGTPYSPLYTADTRDYREFQVDLQSGDFSTPERSNQVDADSWEVSPNLIDNESYKIRIRDVSVNGTISEWSDEVLLTTIDVVIAEPTVSVEGSPDAVPVNPTISTSAFSSTNNLGAHESTDWEVIRTSDSTVVFESLNDTSNLTSITVTADLDREDEFEFRVRHRDATFGASNYGSTTATTNAFVDEPTVSVEGSPDAVPPNPTMSTSAFSVTNGSDTHESTDWQVIRTSDSTVVFESLNDTVNLTSITVTTDLDRQDQFEFRARHRGTDYGTSSYGSTTATTDAFVDEPTVSVEDGPSDVPENPVISTSAFSVTNGSDTHESTDWEVIRTSDSVTVFSSTGDTSNLTSITVTTDLDESTEYEFRARHNGATFGSSAFGSVTATTLTFFAPTTLGQSFEGGFYMGTIAAAGTTYYLVVAPNATGCERCPWKTSTSTTSDTCSFTDGYANTYPALENSTHPAGNWTATRTIGGFSDWYLPAINELEVFYNNGGGAGSGDPLPSGEDFDFDDYWSSVDSRASSAYYLSFSNGNRDDYLKTTPRSLRAVRRVPI